MRLIDADRLYRKVKTECNPYGKPSIGYEDGNKVLDLIKAAPTVEERKVGKWIYVRTEPDGNAFYYCSECGKGEVHVPIVEVKYCWNCGARME